MDMNTDSRDNTPVVVASFLNPNEAHIARGLLESEGIETFIYNERSAIYTPVAVDGVQVAVRGKDYDRAKALLGEAKPEPQD